MDTKFSPAPDLQIGGNVIQKGPTWVADYLMKDQRPTQLETFVMPTDPVSSVLFHGSFPFDCCS